MKHLPYPKRPAADRNLSDVQYNSLIEGGYEPKPDYRDTWQKASADEIFKALIPGWKAAEK